MLKRMLQFSLFLIQKHFVDIHRALGKAAKDDIQGRRVLINELLRRGHGDARSLLQRIAIYARADGRKGDGFNLILNGEFQGSPIASAEQLGFAGVSAMPHGADGVNHESRGQLEPGRDSGVANRASIQ